MAKPEAVENENRTQPDGLLYHYTNEAGLFGILRSSCIWATDYRFLNDTSEREHAVTLFSQELSMQANGRLAKRLGAAIRRFDTSQTQDLVQEIYRSVSAYYVSFSSDANDSPLSGDRLSQWRGYAQNGQGFSLGFHRGRLLKTAKRLET